MFLTVNFKKFLFGFLLAAIVAFAITFVLLFSEKGDTTVSSFAEQEAPILVIDPGHGGEDGGAVSVCGTPESGINLDISLRMEALADFMGLPCVLTREGNAIDYPKEANTAARRKVYDQKARIKLINETPNAVLISVHQNCFPHRAPRGPQTFYAKTEGSSDLAILVQSIMNTAIYPENRRIATPVARNIYLMKNISCPAVLAECGFLSNPEEAKLLESESYRLKIAAALLCGYLQFLDDY
ncbi:MAG: N-acetylmuramoyl-L-alanine amidase [Oscillospiraceae bacterium]